MLEKIPYCFTKSEVIQQFSSKDQFDNWIKTKIKNKQIKKVRNGLYVSLDQEGVVNVTKFEIASKISKTAVICYHSALEFYGLANQVFNDMVVGSLSRFNLFEFDGVEFSCKIIKNYEQIIYKEIEKVRVTSLERTIIDCIDNIDLAGGIDEILNALEQIKILDENKLLSVLKSYNQVLLYQKVGYILEQFKNELMISDDFFKECQKKLTNQVKYFLCDDYKNIVYNRKWHLMAPKNIKTRIYGGL